jgi:DNA polymerase-3 subunit gamma/tau
MLRTFDELGYRQEQRFHFELGLLKLVHLRRLLPIEEVLSQFPVGGGSRPGPGVATARTVSPPAPAPARNLVSGAATARALHTEATVSAAPAFSPFEKDQRRRFDEKAVVAAPIASPMPVPIAAAMPVPVAVPMPSLVSVPREMVLTEEDAAGAAIIEAGDLAEGVSVNAAQVAEERSEPVTENADAPRGSEAMPSPSSYSAESLQKAAVDALVAAKNQDTPADALDNAEWTVSESEVRVQTDLSKTMLPMVVNGEAEKLVKNALRDAGAGALKLVLLPGTKSAAAAKKTRAPKSGSAQAKAMEHPIVQRAQTLFNAEIRSVIDLRDTD